MGQSNNREPRRLWKSTESNRASCASCGAHAHLHGPHLAFCDACLDWARQSNFAECDEPSACAHDDDD